MEDPIAIHSARHFHTSFYDRSLPIPPSHHTSPFGLHRRSSPASSPNAYFSSPPTRAPPSPPRERMHGVNLPPITDLLNLSRADHAERSHSRRAPSSSHSRPARSPHQNSNHKYQETSPISGPGATGGGSFLLPPTPPMQPVKSVSQAPAPSQLLPPPSFPASYQALEAHQNHPESHHPRQTSLPNSVVSQRSSYPAASPHSMGSSSLHGSPQLNHHHHHHHHHGSSTDQSHPRHRSMPGLITQQPLPTDFPPHIPSQLPTPHSSISGASSNDVSASSSAHTSWQPQHHSHVSPTTPNSAGPFGTSQDRYVCATCTKAFSRPSSLRIHSHSHTGEKPFKCPHKGCGKAFSVRSNMKRHERGCHAERALQSEAAGIATAVTGAGGRELLPAS